MAKKIRKKKSSKTRRRKRRAGPRKMTKYSPAEIAMAVLGAALLIMVAGIIITALLG